jgi:hypothetical protein
MMAHQVKLFNLAQRHQPNVGILQRIHAVGPSHDSVIDRQASSVQDLTRRSEP